MFLEDVIMLKLNESIEILFDLSINKYKYGILVNNEDIFPEKLINLTRFTNYEPHLSVFSYQAT